MHTDASGLVVLDRDVCLQLLRGHPVHVGRVGICGADGQPLVMPVNYHLDGETIVFRTESQSVISDHAGGSRIAFEVDDVDPAWREGWSVLVQGRADRVTDVEELHRLRELPLRPWAPGSHPLYVRITPEDISGRRIV